MNTSLAETDRLDGDQFGRLDEADTPVAKLYD